MESSSYRKGKKISKILNLFLTGYLSKYMYKKHYQGTNVNVM